MGFGLKVESPGGFRGFMGFGFYRGPLVLYTDLYRV